jgi:hypothetical protein
MADSAWDAVGGKNTKAKANARHASVFSHAEMVFFDFMSYAWAKPNRLSMHPALEGFQHFREVGTNLPMTLTLKPYLKHLVPEFRSNSWLLTFTAAAITTGVTTSCDDFLHRREISICSARMLIICRLDILFALLSVLNLGRTQIGGGGKIPWPNNKPRCLSLCL